MDEKATSANLPLRDNVDFYPYAYNKISLIIYNANEELIMKAG